MTVSRVTSSRKPQCGKHGPKKVLAATVRFNQESGLLAFLKDLRNSLKKARKTGGLVSTFLESDVGLLQFEVQVPPIDTQRKESPGK